MAVPKRVAVKAVAKIGSKGRVYISPEIRELLDLKEGDFIAFEEEKGKFFVKKVK